MKIKKTISLVINTRNEEKNIKKCIKSVGNLVNEVVVVDMESTDKTVALAKEMGARVFTHKNFDYVEPARNFAVNKASSEWVLILDADERISKTLKNKIKKVINTSQYNVVSIPRMNIIFNKWIKNSGDYWPNYQMRLFKKGYVDWPKTIHSGGITKEDILYLPKQKKYALEHLIEVNTDSLLEKTDRYSSADTSFEKYIDSKEFSAEHIINYLNHELRSRYVANKGYENGFGGFILYKLIETYRFAEIAKYWLRNNQPKIKEEQEFISYYLELSEFQNSNIFKLWRKWKKLSRFLGFNNNSL